MPKGKRDKIPGKAIRNRVENVEVDPITGLPVTPGNEQAIHPLMRQREMRRNLIPPKKVEVVQEKEDNPQN
jgi:hypothetical protein